MEGVGVVDLGLMDERGLEVADDDLKVIDESEVGGEALTDAGVVEAFADPLPVGAVGDALARGRQVVLMVGVLDVGEELSALTDEVKPPAHEVPACSHLCWIDVCLGEQSSSEE